MQIYYVKRYTSKEVALKVLNTDHCGPWETAPLQAMSDKELENYIQGLLDSGCPPSPEEIKKIKRENERAQDREGKIAL